MTTKAQKKIARDLRVERRITRIEVMILLMFLKTGGELLPLVSALIA